MEVYQSIRTYRFRMQVSKKLELAELLTLVDPKATQTKKDQLIVYLKTRIYLHITGQI
jgi:hypothetical protein